MKNIQVGDEIHAQAKITATMEGISIREFTERALRSWIAPEATVLVDTRATYNVADKAWMESKRARYSINPRYDCNPNETDEEESDE